MKCGAEKMFGEKYNTYKSVKSKTDKGDNELWAFNKGLFQGYLNGTTTF